MKTNDRPAVVEERVVADEGGAHTGFSEAQERMFTLMTGELSHDMGLRLIIRSIEQLRKEPSWPYCASAVNEDVQALIDKYGITSGSGMDLLESWVHVDPACFNAAPMLLMFLVLFFCSSRY